MGMAILDREATLDPIVFEVVPEQIAEIEDEAARQRGDGEQPEHTPGHAALEPGQTPIGRQEMHDAGQPLEREIGRRVHP